VQGEPWDPVVSSYAIEVDERLLLFDPITPPKELEKMAEGRQTAIVLTCPWHEREARGLVERFGWPVYTPRPDTAEDLMRQFGLTAEQAEGGSPDVTWLRDGEVGEAHWYSAGDQLPVGVEVFPGQKPNDLVLWIESRRAVVAGDTLVDFGQGVFINPRWLGPGVTYEQVVEGLSPLLERRVEHMLATHGGPFDGAALERALTTPSRWTGMSGYAVAHIDEIPELVPTGESPMRPVRHHFGITSFGVNAWVAKEAGDRIINEHQEDAPDGQEELYIVTRGRAVFELDGERRDAPAGTLVAVPKSVTRTAFAEEAGTTVVSVGGTPGEAYYPAGWELWYPLRQRYLAGERAEVLEPLRKIVAENPQYALLHYNLACLESLNGNRAEAIEQLGEAIELQEQFRKYAKNDPDLDAVRDDPAFKDLVGG
jgi:glyoxylase-like metal-dependent hydrolase (beta-lactamase superfamily II)